MLKLKAMYDDGAGWYDTVTVVAFVQKHSHPNVGETLAVILQNGVLKSVPLNRLTQVEMESV